MIEKVYKDRDNTNDFTLKADGVKADLSGVTRMVLDFGGGVIVDSAVTAGVFDWSGGDGELKLTLGDVEALTAGQRYNPSLIVYDTVNDDGINWGQIPILVL